MSHVTLAIALGLALSTELAAAQGGRVEGRVTAAATGAPIPSAEVSVVGTNLGTRTDPDGRFALLNVPAGPHDLRILAIGYKLGTLRLVVRSDTVNSADAQLTPSVLELDAVVVTGTAGVARVREVGNSIAKVNLAEVKDPPANMDQLLQARAPGLSVMQTSGMAGEGAQIRLRGAVSVTQSNQPIVYVDGIRVRSEGYRRNRPPFDDSNGFRGANYQASPLNDISPADVDHIEIIKGSAASTRASFRFSPNTAPAVRPAGRSRPGRDSPSCARSAPTRFPISISGPRGPRTGSVTRPPSRGAPGSATPTARITPAPCRGD